MAAPARSPTPIPKAGWRASSIPSGCPFNATRVAKMNRRTMMKWLQLFAVAALAYLLLPGLSHAERVKDIASVSGVRTNQIVGYGLVVGLSGTGDQTTQAPFTTQSIANMLAKFGITLSASVVSQMQLKNVAAVSVTADLPPFV